MKQWILLFCLILVGCSNAVPTQIGCSDPFIASGSACCIDGNGNGICDSDETVEIPAPFTTPTNFEECVAAGNAVMESYPRQCRSNDVTFVEEIEPIVERSPAKNYCGPNECMRSHVDCEELGGSLKLGEYEDCSDEEGCCEV